MTIDEAIEIIKDIEPAKLYYFLDNEKQAIKLGIEALKQIRNNRTGSWIPPELLLLGETKD